MERRTGAVAAGVLLFVAALTCFPSIGIAGAKIGTSLCLETVIPSLFPYMLACDLLFRLVSGAHRLPRWAPLLCALLFAFTGGFVLGLTSLKALVDQGALERRRAEVLLAGCINAGPTFLISGVGVGLFGSAATGLLLFLSLSLASLVCLAVFGLAGSRFCAPRASLQSGRTEAKRSPAKQGFERIHAENCRAQAREFTPRADLNPIDTSPSTPFYGHHGAAAAPKNRKSASERGLIGLSLAGSVRAVATLCGFVVLFACVGGYLRALLALLGAGAAAQWLPLALLEVTGGCRAASDLSGGVYFAAASVSLCSASILLQLRSLAGGSLSLRWLLLSRPLHLGLSLLFVRLLSELGGAGTVFSILGGEIFEPFSFSPLFDVLAFALSAAAVAGERLHIAKRAPYGIIKKKARRPE